VALSLTWWCHEITVPAVIWRRGRALTERMYLRDKVVSCAHSDLAVCSRWRLSDSTTIFIHIVTENRMFVVLRLNRGGVSSSKLVLGCPTRFQDCVKLGTRDWTPRSTLRILWTRTDWTRGVFMKFRELSNLPLFLVRPSRTSNYHPLNKKSCPYSP